MAPSNAISFELHPLRETLYNELHGRPGSSYCAFCARLRHFHPLQ